MDPQERLREHIRKMFSSAGLKLSPDLAQTLESQFILLFNDYARATIGTKDEVYERGERRILQIIEAEMSGKPLTASGEHRVPVS